MKGLCQPAFLSLPRIEPFDFSARARLRATRLIMARFSGPFSLRFRACLLPVRWPGGQAGAVFVHGHIQHPVQAVLNGPMSAGHSKETLGGETCLLPVRWPGGQAGLCGGFSILLTCRHDLADRLQTRPVMARLQPIQVMAYPGPARFNTPMTAINTLKCITNARMARRIQKQRYLFMKRALIALQSQNIITARLPACSRQA